MATRASAKRKRGSAPVSPPSDDGRVVAQRFQIGSGGASAVVAAEQEEPPTLVEVQGTWVEVMQPAREARQFIDVTLLAAGRRIEAHRIVLVSLSPYIAGLLTSGLAESATQSQELTLEDMDGRAVEAVVDCMYSGKLALSSHTVTAVIRVANILQVGAAEKAAAEFFASRLEPSTAADALGFAAERAECGEHAKALHESCMQYAVEHFAAVSHEASFCSLPAETVVGLIGRDELPVDEHDVVSVVRRWFEHDAEGRRESLKELMPLIRWPLLPVDARLGLPNEPLFGILGALGGESRKLSFRLMLECGSTDSASRVTKYHTPRFTPRKGTAQPALAVLAFTDVDPAYYETQDEGATLLPIDEDAEFRAAKCTGHVMNSGKNCAEMSIVSVNRGNDVSVMCGVARPGLDASEVDAYATTEPCEFWGYDCDGNMYYGAYTGNGWAGHQGYGAGDVLRLLLDSDAGTLTVKKNGVLLGVAVSEGLTGDLCWAVAVGDDRAHGVHIEAVDPANF